MKQRYFLLLVSLMVLLGMGVPVYFKGSTNPEHMQTAADEFTSDNTEISAHKPIEQDVESNDTHFNGDFAYAHVVNQVALGPRPVGSRANRLAGEQITRTLEDLGWRVETSDFVFRGIQGRNIIAKAGQGSIVMLGAHYDTRPISDREWAPESRRLPIAGANDAASGVAVLLELARVLDVDRTDHQVWLAFFDAEDRGGIDDWPYSVGARVMVSELEATPEAVVIVDMVGDADQQIYFEKFSDRALSKEIWDIAAQLGYEDQLIPQVRHAIGHDHLPFIEAGIPAIGIIDFDYRYWHTQQDTPDKLSPLSLERVGKTLVTWLYERNTGQNQLHIVEHRDR